MVLNMNRIIKVGASPQWSSLYYPGRNSNEMTIGKTHGEFLASAATYIKAYQLRITVTQIQPSQ